MTCTRRSGFTLNEVVISLVIIGIIGASFTRILTYQTRYLAHQTSLRTARRVARAGTNILMSDLRAVQDSGGVDSVAADGKLIRIFVPYRSGLVCGTNGSTTTVSMLPIDSATIALSVYKGFAWRNATGRYTYVTPPDPTGDHIPLTSSTPAVCTGNGAGQAQIRTVTAGVRSGQILDLKTNGPSGATVGSPVFMFQRISYSFKLSTAYPNAYGLYRNVEGGANEELVAPFDSLTARFRFFKTGDDVSRTTPPAIADIRGIELVLAALSPIRSTNLAGKPAETIVTSVFFKNVRAY